MSKERKKKMSLSEENHIASLIHFTYSEEKKYKVCAIKCKIYLSLRKIYLPLRHDSYVREFYLMYNLKKMYAMKKSYLLPVGFKKAGLWMVVPFLVLSALCLCDSDVLVNICINATVPAVISHEGWFRMTETSLIEEIAMLGLLASLVFIALSREQDEDEMTAHIRMQSFVWSTWATSIVLAMGILFVYDLEFLTFMFLTMYLYLMLYIVKFNLAMHRERKEQR